MKERGLNDKTSIKRIFIKECVEGSVIKLDAQNFHYIKNVLRYKMNDSILVFDGEKEYLGIYQNKYIQICEVIRVAKKNHELKLAIAAIKQSNFEWLIEKATEIGVDEIFVLQTKRTQNEINFNRVEKIIIEAAKQSKRINIPKIYPKITLHSFLDAISSDWCYGSIDTVNVQTKGNISGVIIGPEGGFDEQEIVMLNQKTLALKLNCNTLRSETAAICALAIINKNFI